MTDRPWLGASDTATSRGITVSNTIGLELEHFLNLVLINKDGCDFNDVNTVISGEIGADSIKFIEFTRSIMNAGEFIYD